MLQNFKGWQKSQPNNTDLSGFFPWLEKLQSSMKDYTLKALINLPGFPDGASTPGNALPVARGRKYSNSLCLKISTLI
jgi:hypothetical protein